MPTVIETILDDVVEAKTASNGPPFAATFDYAQEIAKRDAAAAKWKTMDEPARLPHKGKLENFFVHEGVADLKSNEGLQAKSLHLLRSEISQQVAAPNPLKLVIVEELHFSSALIELLENVENTEHIRDLYRLRKRTTGKDKKSGIGSEEATRLKNCMRQGRELYTSGLAGSLMVKPLNFFYALTAYSYAAIILNNPIRYSLENLPGSHGINYLPNDIKTQFGGDMPQGTFSDLFAAFPTTQVFGRQVDFLQDNEASILAFFNSRHTASCGALLSMVPEIREYYTLVTGRSSRTYPLEITTTKDPRNVKWELQVGDGEARPSAADVAQSFPGADVSERHGKFVVTFPIADAHKCRATIYTDIRGRFWYIENPFFPVVMPETCLHFLLTNIFSNIMRYSPDHWGDVLLNEVRSDISLITRKYLSAFENKFPVLMLRSISKFFPYVSAEG
ncbi:UNVERIFIED_ORG: YaaC family protein [Shinella sp. XGS7]|nr:YaaC family protein [Shinella sp. XGS7]